MPQRDLQVLVDELADRLRRPVGIDDAQFRSLAYSAHMDEADPVRLASILRRRAPAEVTSWLVGELGVHCARTPIRVEANAELGLAPRVCVPIRFEELLLGYVWLVDTEPGLSDDELETAVVTAADAADVLYRDRLLQQADRQREGTLVAELMADDPAASAAAAQSLQGGALLDRAASYAVVVLLASPAARLADDAVRTHLTAAAERARRLTSARGASAASLRQGIAVVLAEPSSAMIDDLAALATAALDGLDDVTAAVGCSGPVAELGDARAAYRQALVAGDVARRIGVQLRRWDDLGALQVLGTVDPEPWTWQVLWPLLDQPATDLLTTLEHYLETGGTATRAAEDLHLHRTTLYHRLRHVEKLCGIDLADGDDRLRTHMALRLWRLAGAPPAS